jgi:hypothetical protein
MFDLLHQPDLSDAEVFALMCEYDHLLLKRGAICRGELPAGQLDYISQQIEALNIVLEAIDFSVR